VFVLVRHSVFLTGPLSSPFFIAVRSARPLGFQSQRQVLVLPTGDFLWSALARICVPSSASHVGAAGFPLKREVVLTNLFLILAAAKFVRIVI
jgi:hypothetical protein